MPEVKICPFFLIFYKTTNNTCIESQCNLWSESSSLCSITEGMLNLSYLHESLRTLIDIINDRIPDRT